MPTSAVRLINEADAFTLTTATAAHGMETSFWQFKRAYTKPFILAALLALWLFASGFGLVWLFVS